MQTILDVIIGENQSAAIKKQSDITHFPPFEM